jgi:hypothetical protein
MLAHNCRGFLELASALTGEEFALRGDVEDPGQPS